MISISDFVKNLSAFKVATFASDSNGATNALVLPNNKKMAFGSHVRAVLLGDSITRRAQAQGINTSASASGVWNWANWMVGSPFIYTNNLAISGDKTQSILSRVSAVPGNVQIVMLMTGTNDIFGMSSSANQVTIDSTYTTISGYIQAGVNALTATGKRVVISTILPNDAFSSSSDSRIQLLDRLNAFITSLASSGSIFVIDGFTALWDSAQPTLRVAKTNSMVADGTHPSNLGAHLFGLASITAMKSAYNACVPDYDLYQDYALAYGVYSSFRTGTGGTAGIKTAGTGTLADGWRTINNAGTATFALDNSAAYSVSPDYVGHIATVPAGIDERWQEFNITSAAASDNPRMQNGVAISNLTGFPDSILGGDLFFAEMDVMVTNPVALTECSLSLFDFFANGTSPADQAYMGTTYNSVKSGMSSDYSSTPQVYPGSFRCLLRTPILRCPENINVTTTQNLALYVDMIFNGAGSANIKLGRPRIWRKCGGFI